MVKKKQSEIDLTEYVDIFITELIKSVLDYPYRYLIYNNEYKINKKYFELRNIIKDVLLEELNISKKPYRLNKNKEIQYDLHFILMNVVSIAEEHLRNEKEVLYVTKNNIISDDTLRKYLLPSVDICIEKNSYGNLQIVKYTHKNKSPIENNKRYYEIFVEELNNAIRLYFKEHNLGKVYKNTKAENEYLKKLKISDSDVDLLYNYVEDITYLKLND